MSVSPHTWSVADREFMARALDLGRRGAGRTWSNPMVGAIVVAGGREIASGFHARCGDAHAESVAIDAAGEHARGATLYVSLEPCAHHGRTPPCVERIVEAGIARVVVPALDPDPRVCGRGVEQLRARGLEVDVGCEADAAVLENLGYYHDRLDVDATVTLKTATSSDGMVARAPGRRDDITGAAARRDVHELRAVHDAVVVGVETVRVDRPALDCRLLPSGVDHEPVPVVLDTHLRLPLDNAWTRAGRAFLVLAGPHPDPRLVAAIEARGGRVVACAAGAGGVSVHDAVERLSATGLRRILVEGGARVFRSFLDAGAWDAVWRYQSSVRFGEGVALFEGAGDVPGRLGVPIDEVALGADRRWRSINPRTWERLASRMEARARA